MTRKKRLLIILCCLVASVIGVILAHESQQPVPAECQSANWTPTYIGWDDFAGPCTYLQRVAFDIFMVTILPFLMLWPLTLVLMCYFMYRLVNRKVKPVIDETLLIGINSVMILWLLMIALMYFMAH